MNWSKIKKTMKCEKCGRDLITIDYPDMVLYHNEDTKWGIWPDHETGDPGMLVAKAGAKPLYMTCHKQSLPTH